MIPYSTQDLDVADIQAVLAVLQSDFLTQGPAVAQFEQALAQATGVPYAVAVSSATAALHLACLAAGLGPGDWLWTVPNTFVASANCGLYCGAQVDFVDIDPHTYTLSVPALTEKLAQAEKTGRLPKVVIPVHFAGQPCEMAAIAHLADRYGFTVIEDAAHALGATYRGQPVGGLSPMTVFSFHPVKMITTGEGGAITTHDPSLAERLRRLRSHGITPGVGDAPWEYRLTELGYHYRMTDIQAALGHSQLQRLEQFVATRRQLAEQYNELLADMPGVTPAWQHPNGQSSWHLYVVQLANATIRARAYETLRAEGFGVQVHYQPVHTQPLYQQQGFQPQHCPQAMAYYQRALSLPLHTRLVPETLTHVVTSIKRCLQ